MGNEWVDIDLDYFNGFRAPMSAFERVILSLPQQAPAFFCIDHHHVLPIVKKAIQDKLIDTPMSIFRVDDHHDYYHVKYFPRKNKDINCGNFGFRVPLKSYRKFVWVTNKRDRDVYWSVAKNWIEKKGKIAEICKSACLKSVPWNPSNVGLVTITVSPDFQCLEYNLSAMLELAAEYFSIPRRPYVRDKGEISYSEDWEIRPRPVCLKGNVSSMTER
ncbi:MAG: hypothetical protein WC390_10130 [Sulfurimonas sp.]|jgi:hypothetical protein